MIKITPEIANTLDFGEPTEPSENSSGWREWSDCLWLHSQTGLSLQVVETDVYWLVFLIKNKSVFFSKRFGNQGVALTFAKKLIGAE